MPIDKKPNGLGTAYFKSSSNTAGPSKRMQDYTESSFEPWKIRRITNMHLSLGEYFIAEAAFQQQNHFQRAIK